MTEFASLVNDNRLIGKLASGDMVAIEGKYHAKCLVDLYNQTRKLKFSLKFENASSYKQRNLHFQNLLPLLMRVLKLKSQLC